MDPPAPTPLTVAKFPCLAYGLVRSCRRLFGRGVSAMGVAAVAGVACVAAVAGVADVAAVALWSEMVPFPGKIQQMKIQMHNQLKIDGTLRVTFPVGLMKGGHL
jgi:hypothetical protein